MASDLSEIRTGDRLTVGLQCYLKPLRFLRGTFFAEFNILYKQSSILDMCYTGHTFRLLRAKNWMSDNLIIPTLTFEGNVL